MAGMKKAGTLFTNRGNYIRRAWALWLPTELSSQPSAALQFAHGYDDGKEVPLHAMRDDGGPLRLRKILLPMPVAHGSPPMRRRLVLLQALPGSLRLQGVRFGFEFELVASSFRSIR
jgi:hypothetical protein